MLLHWKGTLVVKEHPLNVRSWPLCPTPTTERSPEPLEKLLKHWLCAVYWCIVVRTRKIFLNLCAFDHKVYFAWLTSIVKTHKCWVSSLSGIEWSVCLCVLFSCCSFLYRQLCVGNVFVCYKVLNEAFVCVYCFRVVVSCIANCALAMCLFVIRAWPSFGVGLKHAGGHTVTIGDS